MPGAPGPGAWGPTGLGVAVAVFLAFFFVGDTSSRADDEDASSTPQGYDGGFPVPPMPEGGAVRGAAANLTFDTGQPVAAVAAVEEKS